MVVVGIDVGGTFTDLTEIDETTGAVRITKVVSTPNDEARAVMSGLERIADPRQVRRVVHGTTVATNAIIQRRGARVAYVTTAGFRDLIEIGRTKRNMPALFNPTFVRRRPPVERPLRFEVGERMLADGTVLRPLDDADVRRLCEQMRESRAEAFAVCLLFSYANPAHERRLGDALARAFPGVPVSLSSDVVPEYREFERFSTTVFNAYIRPLMERYLESLEKTLVAAGYPPGVLTVGSSGGALTVDAARRLPIKTISSGPAGGVSQAIFLARVIEVPNLITYDIGGTSTDVCLVLGYEAGVTTETMLAGFPVKTPQIDIKSVGAGGGSLAWVDVDGSLQVGPHSAGAEPGPACYGRGGREATVSDANLLLGRLSATQPLGGTIRPDPSLATEVIARLADRLGGFDLHRLADGIIRIMVARTVSSIREISIQRGHDPRDFELMAFGGAGGMHAIPTAEELGISRIVIPRFPGNFSALGVAASDIKHDAVRTHIAPLDGALPAIHATFAELRARAARQLQEDGFGPAETRFVFSLDLRYLGQAFELNVAVDATTSTVADIVRAFHAKHLQSYGHMNESASVELVNIRLTAYGVVAKAPPPRYRSPVTSLAEALREERAVYFDDAFVRCPVYDRDRLPESAVLAGAAIVEEFGATTVIFPAWRGRVDEFGNLRLERQS
ncbi:MAG TPA: hydantoinase/oxoprolinase family protein [Methylomirabilota bacterium]|jgi:N-methylhydantoinase A|nr:hydantoinase/oxoprolinase family protein [Methylomirabilota bacterium]